MSSPELVLTDTVLDHNAQAAVSHIFFVFEPAFRELDPRFPNDCCVPICFMLNAYLHGGTLDHLAGPDFLHVRYRGDFTHWSGTRRVVKTTRGITTMRAEYHHWLEADDGTIVDPTAGQHLGGSPIHFILPESSDHRNYKKQEEHVIAT